MARRVNARLFHTVVLVLLSGSLVMAAQTSQTSAQTQVRPITALPKAPGDDSAATSAQAATPSPASSDAPKPVRKGARRRIAKPSADPATTPTADAPVPADQIHPITSLPKPPGQVAPVSVQAAPAVNATTAPATTVPAETQPAVAPPAVVNAPVVVNDPTVVAAPTTPAAQAPPAVVETAKPTAAPMPDAPKMDAAPLRVMTTEDNQERPRVVRHNMRPFSTVAIQIKGGFAGYGVDVATPLAQHFNLRLGGSFFSYAGSYDVDGISFDGEVKFRSGTVQVDYYPFKNGFRMSPGVTVYNGNNLNANLHVPGGQFFDLGDGTYQSSPIDPVHGTGSFNFGKRTAPSFTIGYGNMIPRMGGHFSMPFEIGFQYIGEPSINFNLQGTACDQKGCGDIATDPQAQADLKQELSDINSDIKLLRFYPIISLGVAWKF